MAELVVLATLPKSVALVVEGTADDWAIGWPAPESPISGLAA